MMQDMPFLLVSALLVHATAATANAPAGAPPPARDDAPEAHAAPDAAHAHDQNGVSARVLLGRAMVADEHVPLAGLGVAVEHDFFDGLVAVEGALEWLAEPHGGAILVELVLEKPIALTEGSWLYLGGGPVFAEHLEAAHDPHASGGALGLIGVETEIAPHWEVFLELDTAVLYAARPVVETDLGAGVMWRF